MKKLLDIVANGRRSQEHFYDLRDASVPENRNYHFVKSNVFKYYPFDSDSYDTCKLGDVVFCTSRVKSVDDSEEHPAHSLSIPNLSTSTVTNSLDSQPKNEFLATSRTNSVSDGSVIEVEKESDCEPETKSRDKKNMYLINISNSKYFLIGSQKTINVNEKRVGQDGEVHNWIKNDSFYLKDDFQYLLDCQERLATKYISLISQHVDDRWKEFLKYLGLKKTALDSLELRSNNNRALSVYDALHKYMTQFPNTSLGFVIFALGQVQECNIEYEKCGLSLVNVNITRVNVDTHNALTVNVELVGDLFFGGLALVKRPLTRALTLGQLRIFFPSSFIYSFIPQDELVESR